MNSCSVLVVDDQPSKIAKVIDTLLSTGHFSRDDIDVAQSGYDARRFLRAKRYDLVVLDVVLPNRPEESPTPDGGVELLRELMTRDHLQRPRYIIGLTGYPEAFQNAAGEFADYTWAIVQYADNDDSWQDPIHQLTRHIVRASQQLSPTTFTHDCDICVVTALPMELKAVLSVGWAWTSIRVPGDATTYSEARVAVGNFNRSVRIVAACAPRMGMISTAVLTTNMIRTFKPRLIAIVGICAGVRGKISLGDVAVADPSWDYQSGKVSGDTFELAPHQLPLHSAIRRRIVELGSDELFSRMRSSWQGAAPKTAISLHVGPFASGSAVLANKQKLEELKLQHRNLIAIDMEVYGVYAAAAEAPAPAPYPLAIKAISDFGDEQKGDDVREYSSYVSASVLAAFVTREYTGLLDLLGC